MSFPFRPKGICDLLTGFQVGSGASGPRNPALGGNETLLTIVSIKNTSGSSKTNEPVVIPLPTNATAYDTRTKLILYDDDGSGGKGAAIGFQVDQIASDNNSKRRFCVVTGIVPSFSANQNRKLRLFTTTAAEPTGTAITASDILATSYNVRVSYTIGGTTYTADATTALGGGSTFTKTTAWTRGTFRSGGYCTAIICEMPLMNGGTAHGATPGEGLHAVFHIYAYKAGSGAVSGGNPITYVFTRVVVENGNLERAAPLDYTCTAASISRATSLSDPTLISTTDTDADGNTITYNYSAGFNHPYGERFSRPVFIGTKPTNVMAWGNVSDASNASVVMRDWLSSNYMYINNQTAAADVTTAPWEYDETLPFQDTGDMLADQGTGGERIEIGLFAGWTLQALVKWNAQARNRMFLDYERINYYYTACISRRFSTPSTGVIGGYRYPDSQQYAFNPAFGGTTINVPVSWVTNFTQVQAAHEPDQCIGAYLCSGEYYWLDSMSSHAGTYQFFSDPFYGGSGINQTINGNSGTSGATNGVLFNEQQRGMAWGTRNVGALALLTPDSFSDGKMGWSKSIAQTWYGNHITKWDTGTNANTDGGLNYWTSTGIRWMVGGNGQNGFGNDSQFAPWQLGYTAHVVAWLDGVGMGGTALSRFATWLGYYFAQAYANANVAPDYIVSTYYSVFYQYNDGTNPGALITAWDVFYQQNALAVPGVGNGAGGVQRKPGGTLTLSATSGASVSVTLPSALLGQTSWYIGGWVRAGSGRGRITAVADSSHCTIDTTVANGAAFASTSIAQSGLDVFPAWTIPGPNPSDAPADGTTHINYDEGENPNYIDVYRCSCAVMADLGVSGASSAYTYANGWLPHASADSTSMKYDVIPR